MEIISEISGHWLEVLTAVYLLGMTLYGHYKGAIRLAVSAAATAIVLAAVNVATPMVMNWLEHDTPVYEYVKENVAERMELEALLENMHLTEKLQREDEWYIIEELQLPAQIKEKLIENNNIEVYKELGVQHFQEYIAGYLAGVILKALVFVSLFIVGSILLHVAVRWLDLIAKLPILSGMNKIAGAFLGAVQAMLFLWIACLMITALSGTPAGKIFTEQIASSKWLTWIYEHNLLTRLFLGWIYTVI